MRARVLNRNGNLVCKDIKDFSILGLKRIYFCALHIQNTDDLVTDLEWQGKFGVRFREVRVVFERRIQFHIQRDTGRS